MTNYDPWEPIGVVVRRLGLYSLAFPGGRSLPSGVERSCYKDYFTNDEWPTNPKTGKRLPVVEDE